jgi:O-methyltransferase.
LGHDLAGLKRKFPNLPGRLVLEDLSDGIEHAKESIEDGIEVVGYDMFTEQPLKGAKAYYLRTVLHDWPDKQSLMALARVREAMADDSVLLINENTLPEVGASSLSVSLDISMMDIFASLERTEKQWVDLLERASFRVVKVWRADYDGIGSNALAEAVACQL